MARLSPAQAMELYHVDGWGDGLFTVTDQGRLAVQPEGPDGPRFRFISQGYETTVPVMEIAHANE